MFLEDFLAGPGELTPQLEFEQLPFSHPLFIMFSSGTTGAPKCMVHSAGVGLLLAAVPFPGRRLGGEPVLLPERALGRWDSREGPQHS